MPNNNRLDFRDVIDASQNQQVVIYTGSQFPLEGKLTLSNDKIVRLTVIPTGGTAHYIYIDVDNIVAMVSPISVP